MSTKRFLFVLSDGPSENGVRIGETLDQVMTFAAFDLAVELLVLGDAVMHIARPKTPASPELEPAFEALALYGIETVWVETEALSAHTLNAEALRIPVRTVDRKDVSSLLTRFDVLVGDR